MKKLRLLIIVFGGAVLSVCIFLFINSRLTPKVVLFTPTDGSKNVSLNTTVNVSFDRFLTDKEKTNLHITFDPKVNFTANWVNKEIIIIPQAILGSNTKYLVNVFYFGTKLANFYFSTVLFSPDETKILQNSKNMVLPGDYMFSQVTNDMYTKYPWLVKLPIENSNYRIVYDSVKNQFRIRILVPITSDQQKQNLINQALNDLRSIGVTGSTIPYYILTQ